VGIVVHVSYPEWLRRYRTYGVPGCCACWCPCLLHARNRRRLDHLNTQGLPDPHRDQFVVKDSWVYALIEVACDAGWILQVKIYFYFTHLMHFQPLFYFLFFNYIKPNVLTEQTFLVD
jgi:hypothetical protein